MADTVGHIEDDGSLDALTSGFDRGVSTIAAAGQGISSGVADVLGFSDISDTLANQQTRSLARSIGPAELIPELEGRIRSGENTNRLRQQIKTLPLAQRVRLNRMVQDAQDRIVAKESSDSLNFAKRRRNLEADLQRDLIPSEIEDLRAEIFSGAGGLADRELPQSLRINPEPDLTPLRPIPRDLATRELPPLPSESLVEEEEKRFGRKLLEQERRGARIELEAQRNENLDEAGANRLEEQVTEAALLDTLS